MAGVALGFLSLGTLPAQAAIPAYISDAVADPSRPADDRALDAKRKPAEVLAHAGVRPGLIIGEYLPGGGYYTRLLSLLCIASMKPL
jgi:predicted methyltransferase